jgi:G6PDH family F420-dependent oxidoreductase
MVELGYALSSEEHGPAALVANARAAEEAGFGFALISDHYHPWIDRQGQSPFVWSVIGGIAATTERIRIGTGVTCPTIRIHPAVLAQAAATSAAMLPSRFIFGVGSGENLNEHILGDHWPSEGEVRRRMLEEAVEVIRLLWRGDYRSFDGEFFTVENARLYTLPEEPPPIYIAAGGPESAELAGRIGDGLIATSPDRELVKAFGSGDGSDRPIVGQLAVCWAADEASARRTAHEWWPTGAIPGDAGQELPLPRQFEQLAELVTEEAVAEQVVCGPDAERYLSRIREYADAGFSHVYIHQIGPDQEGFLDFARKELLPRVP